MQNYHVYKRARVVLGTLFGFPTKTMDCGPSRPQYHRALLHLGINPQVFNHGEFDPGSGRTLATCLRNASRTGEQSLVANGRVTRGQPALKWGTTARKGC